MSVSDQPPFGTYAPSVRTVRARALATKTGSGWLAKRVRSLLLRIAGGKSDRAFDVSVFGTQKARLYPKGNISEKRVFTAEHMWDADERTYLNKLIAQGDGPFHFLDVGANAGLYTLSVRAGAQAAHRPLRALVVEPQKQMAERMMFNMAASGAGGDEVILFPFAITDVAKTLRFQIDANNKGQSKVVEGGENVIEVEGRPLLDAITTAGFDRVDAMKIDIEGAELPALHGLFDQAPESLWPRAILIEAYGGEITPAVQLCFDKGYTTAHQTRMNLILSR